MRARLAVYWAALVREKTTKHKEYLLPINKYIFRKKNKKSNKVCVSLLHCLFRLEKNIWGNRSTHKNCKTKIDG